MRWMKVLGIIVLTLTAVLVVVISLTVGWRPFIGPRARPLTDRTFPSTPERLERGRYLANGLMACFDCHTPRNWKKHDAPIIPGNQGEGQVMPLADLPGTIVAPNITPDPETGVGSWTDDELARAIREGVDRDGHTLFPMMPYRFFRSMSDEDLASLVLYLRTLQPIRHALPKTQVIFPVSRLINAVPEPITAPVPAPDVSTPLKRGQYLATLAACADCHTPMVKGQPILSLQFSGGQVFDGPWGKVASANITSDASGIPYYDEKLFLEVMRTG